MEERAKRYWNGVADEKTFTHPLRTDWLAAELAPKARLLDVGCGYGRLTAEVAAAGWPHVIGVDPAERMIDRGRLEHPQLDLRPMPDGRLPVEDASVDAVILVSVLTCIPEPGDQESLLREIERALTPGGHVFFSDLLLQEDERNGARYEEALARGEPLGTFRLDEHGGVRLCHFPHERLEALFAAFEPCRSEEIVVHTMNGHPARALQALYRRRG